MTKNEDNIFCLLGSFINRLKPSDWALISDDKIRLNNKNDKILILDKAKGRIIKELIKMYKVKEVLK